MTRIVLTVAALSLPGGVSVLAPALGADLLGVRRASPALLQGQCSPRQQVQTFTETIKKSGDQFVLSDDSSRSSYELDDQQTGSKFEGQTVRVTGRLDAADNMMIRVQNIVQAMA